MSRWLQQLNIHRKASDEIYQSKVKELLAKFGFDTTENEPQSCQKLAKSWNKIRKNIEDGRRAVAAGLLQRFLDAGVDLRDDVRPVEEVGVVARLFGAQARS